VELKRLPGRGGGVIGGSNWLLGLGAIGLTFSGFDRGSNKSTASKLLLRDSRLFDRGICLIFGFLRVIADLGLDKKSAAVSIASGGFAGEVALILVRLAGCGGNVEGNCT
jgi:hypothetical protein